VVNRLRGRAIRPFPTFRTVMSNQKLDLDFCPTRKRGVIGEGGGVAQVIYNSETEKYFQLDDIGSLVWDMCDGAHCVSQILNQLYMEYEVPSDVLQMDLKELLNQFSTHKLLSKDA
jgi:hypothetical protein